MPNWKKVIVSGSHAALASVTSSFTGSLTGQLIGTASWATNAVSASFVNTLNQNVLITGSLTVGATSLGANENTLVIGPAPAGGTGEGGQILLQAPGGTYTSASMWDNYQNQTRLLRGTNAVSDAVVAQFNMHTKQVSFPQYNNVNSFPGTAAAFLAVDSSGNLLTTSSAGGGGSTTINNNVDNYVITGTGTLNTLNGEANLQFNGTSLTVTGQITASGAIISQANNSMYFRGGDDAEFWDINIANTVGIYGQQNADRAGVKLGSSGPTLFGSASNLGIGTTTPTQATLEVNGNIYATSFTGSLLGTSSWATNAISSSKVFLTASATNLNFPVVFSDTNTIGVTAGGGATGLNVDGTSFIFNPSTNTLIVSTVQGNLTGNVTGNLTGTSSWATNAISSSFPIAVTGTTLYSVSPLSTSTPNTTQSIYLGLNAGVNASNARGSNFIGGSAGSTATNAIFSNFIGNSVGSGATFAEYSNFIGGGTGFGAVSASYSTLIGYSVGADYNGNLSIGRNNIIIGTNITLDPNRQDSINIGGIIFGTGSYFGNAPAFNMFSGSQAGIGRIGINNTLPAYTLDVSGSGNYTNGLRVTGSVIATSFTGSLFGTSSWATNAVTASFLPVGTYNITSSWAQSASNAINAQTASFLSTGTYNITSSWASNALTSSFLPVGTYNITSSWAQTASNALTASVVATSITSNNTNYPVIFVTSSTDSPGSILNLSSNRLFFNPGTGTLSAATYANTNAGTINPITSSWARNAITASFTTSASLATSASKILTQQTSSNALFYPTFVDSDNSIADFESVFTINKFSYSPSTQTLFSANFSGTASWASNALTSSIATSSSFATSASWAPSTATTPGGSDFYIQFNSASAFQGVGDFAYINDPNSGQYQQLFHQSNFDVTTTAYPCQSPASIQIYNTANNGGQQTSLMQAQYTLSSNTGATTIFIFDAGGGGPGNLNSKIQGFKCDYSLVLDDGSSTIASRIGTLMGAWSYDTNLTPALKDDFVDGDAVFNEIKTVLFTLVWNGSNIELQMDCTNVNSASIRFVGLFTIFSNKN